MVRFKYSYTQTTSRNIVKICILMMSENALNCLLKFAVGVKHIFLSLSLLTNLILPSVFFALWIGVFAIAYAKNGEYQAPPGMLYMQQEEEL